MITITCKNCHQEITVPMYFSDVRITTESYSLYDTKDYRAIATGRAICPLCGMEVNEIFSGLITKSDIVKFATERNTSKGD